jgi:hypothetical protein
MSNNNQSSITLLLILGWESSTLLIIYTLINLGLFSDATDNSDMVQPWINLFIWSISWLVYYNRTVFKLLMSLNNLRYNSYKYETEIMLICPVAMYIWGLCIYGNLSTFSYHDFESEYETLAICLELWLLSTTLLLGCPVLKMMYLTCGCGCSLFCWIIKVICCADKGFPNPSAPDFHTLL